MIKWDDLIGVPFCYGGRGPDKYDCYGLVRELHSRTGVVLPDYPTPSDSASITAMMTGELRLWTECDPHIGAVPLITVRDRKGVPNLHCGYMVNNYQFIHTWQDSGGGVIERVDIWRRKILGFYRYVG